MPEFEDPVPQSQLKAVHVHFDDFINCVRCEYFDGTSTEKHGEERGTTDTFSVGNDEGITAVYVWGAFDKVEAIQFYTSSGRTSPKFGKGEDTYRDITLGPTQEGTRILSGFKGGCGQIMENLEPLWVPSTLRARYFKVADPFMGMGIGKFFNDLDVIKDPFEYNFSEIRMLGINHPKGLTGLISIYKVKDNVTGAVNGIGWSGYNDHIMKLDDDEFVTGVDVKWGYGIHSMKIITNKRETPMVGPRSDGVLWEWRAPVKDGVQMGLIGFAGRVGEQVSYLAPIWAERPPYKH